eukprot:jgi/Orpsp1_1/1178359/evm.model.c7180000064999.1
MKINYKLLSILSVISVSVINTVEVLNDDSLLKYEFEKTKNIEEKFMNNEDYSNNKTDDQYYMVFVKNNFSKDGSHNKREENMKYLNTLADEINNLIIVFVASAGNNGNNMDDKPMYPSSFDNVICVGATDNIGFNSVIQHYKELINKLEEKKEEIGEEEYKKEEDELNKKFESQKKKIFENFSKDQTILSENYRAAIFSNFGKNVDIYAPGYANAKYQDINGIDIKDVVAGTSYSSPIVAGVAATIMSENPDIKFDSKKMLEHLTEIDLKDILEEIPEDNPNIFINNGKQAIYSPNGCGSRFNNQTCSESFTCSKEGYCISIEEISDATDNLSDEELDIDINNDSFSEEETNVYE